PRTRDAFGHFANQDRRFDLLHHERSKCIKAKTFVLATCNEDDWLALRTQRLVHCIEVRRLGIIYVFNSAEFAHKFTSVRTWLIPAQWRPHFAEWQSARHAARECRH